MTPRARRRALRARLAKQRSELRARFEATPAGKRAKQRRRRRRALTSAILLLLLLFLRCECEPAPVPPPALEADPPTAPDAGTRPRALAKKPRTERLKTTRRGEYETGNGRPPPWLDDFYTQVAARSPRLAACFTGAAKPGAIRWSTALNPESGAVSDQSFSPVANVELSEQQRVCVQRVLSQPGYRIAEQDRASVPSTVSLVIEF